jgi:hypothetical protein
MNLPENKKNTESYAPYAFENNIFHNSTYIVIISRQNLSLSSNLVAKILKRKMVGFVKVLDTCLCKEKMVGLVKVLNTCLC